MSPTFQYRLEAESSTFPAQAAVTILVCSPAFRRNAQQISGQSLYDDQGGISNGMVIRTKWKYERDEVYPICVLQGSRQRRQRRWTLSPKCDAIAFWSGLFQQANFVVCCWVVRSKLMKRFRQNWILWVLGLAILCYVFILPLLQNLYATISYQPAITRVEPQSLIEVVNQRLIEGLFAGLFFSFGAAIGSFLNVVAYRMPLNRSIVFQPSKCPKCNQRIAGKDNFPVLGWFILKGKCRNCRLPISARYPIVEAIVGTIFLLLFFRQLISGGANLPMRDLSIYRGVVWTLLYMKWDLLAIYVFHVTWFVLLVVSALFAWDGNRISKRLWIFALLVLTVPPMILNYLPQVPFDYLGGQTRLIMSPLVRVGATVGIGAGCGLLLALVTTGFLSPYLGGFKKPDFSAIPSAATANTNPPESVARETLSDELSVKELSEVADVNGMPQDAGIFYAMPDELIPEKSSSGESPAVDPDIISSLQVAASNMQDRAEAADPALVLRDSIGLTMLSAGIVVGWQGLLVITAMTLIWRAICGCYNRLWQSLPYAAWFLIAALLHQMVWRTVVSFLLG
jgi:prepilin signal peptidase PulO-like enzyme (type II secretory pathway)